MNKNRTRLQNKDHYLSTVVHHGTVFEARVKGLRAISASASPFDGRIMCSVFLLTATRLQTSIYVCINLSINRPGQAFSTNVLLTVWSSASWLSSLHIPFTLALRHLVRFLFTLLSAKLWEWITCSFHDAFLCIDRRNKPFSPWLNRKSLSISITFVNFAFATAESNSFSDWLILVGYTENFIHIWFV